MLDLKISQMKLFVAVAETASLSAAASRVGRTASAVSMALKQMEDQLGGPLFMGDRKDALSNLGQFVLETARAQIMVHERAMNSIEAYQAGSIGRLSICAVPSVANQLLPGALERFLEFYPDVQIDMRDTDTVAMTRMLKDGRVEIGFGGPPRDENISFEPLFRDRLLLISKGEVAPDRDPSIPLEALAKTRLIGSGIVDDLIAGLRDIEPAARQLTVHNTASLLALVKAGVGATVLPELAIPKPDRALLTIRPIGEPPITRTVGLLYRDGISLSPAAMAFLECLKDSLPSSEA